RHCPSDLKVPTGIHTLSLHDALPISITAFIAYSADMNRAPAPVTSIEEMSLNRLWAAPKLPRLLFNQLAVSACTVAVSPFDQLGDRKSTRLNSSHDQISYAVFCLKKK